METCDYRMAAEIPLVRPSFIYISYREGWKISKGSFISSQDKWNPPVLPFSKDLIYFGWDFFYQFLKVTLIQFFLRDYYYIYYYYDTAWDAHATTVKIRT